VLEDFFDIKFEAAVLEASAKDELLSEGCRNGE
jgi:hypothetical protein